MLFRSTCLAPTGQKASFPVGTFQFPAFFKAKRRSLDINFSFLFLFPSCYSVTFLLRVVSPITCVAHFALCLLSFLLILRYVPYLNFISFLIFCLLNSSFLFSLHFRLVSSVFMVGYSEIQRTSPSVAFFFRPIRGLARVFC